MTGLILDSPGNHLFVRSVGEHGIRIGDTHFQRSLVISAQQLRDDWPPQDFDAIEAAHLESLLELSPELVLIGSGASQRFLPHPLLGVFYAKGVGVEVMTTEAACRTFNVLVSDGRAAVAALLPVR
jgi:uncharacterized protein